MSIIWTIIIGFVVGVIAKFIMPGDKTEPKGFMLTTVLGIVGAFVATYLGQAVGWYKAEESAGFIASIVGAIILLFVYGLVAGRQGRARLLRPSEARSGAARAERRQSDQVDLRRGLNAARISCENSAGCSQAA